MRPNISLAAMACKCRATVVNINNQLTTTVITCISVKSQTVIFPNMLSKGRVQRANG